MFQDTNKNLRAMDKMLEDYRELGNKKVEKMDWVLYCNLILHKV